MSTPVQAIAVSPGSHLETITAVGIAAAQAYLIDTQTSTTNWDEWLRGSFTKSVRRLRKGSEVTKALTDPLRIRTFHVGAATAHAFRPMTYERFPAYLRRLQVSGLDVPRELDDNPASHISDEWVHPGAEIIINDSVEMTTGKTAAQVAHAMVAWAMQLDPEQRTRWLSYPSTWIHYGSLSRIEELAAVNAAILIRDNGLTEITPGTSTVGVRL